MKKLLLATLLASTSTLAMANTGLYVQGNVGVSKLEAKYDGETDKDNSAGVSIAVGSDTGNVRYALDYTNYGKIKDNESFENGDYDNAEFKAQSVGLSAIYDFESGSALTPYAGVRVGYNQLKLSYSVRETNGSSAEYESGSLKKSKAGFGAVAGVQYAFAPNLALDAGLEYNHLGKFYDAKVNQYGAKIGLRYNF